MIACVVGSIRPIVAAPWLVNHNAPSGPEAIPVGSDTLGSAYSVIAWLVGSIRPIELLPVSVNHSAPSGPAVIPFACLTAASV